ncbi:MAG: ABC transporter ATP-binding protein, partial [Myxococcales bacterium]|nr:ABC transporter ATP-binding protein [Myxococcales bacterium]
VAVVWAPFRKALSLAGVHVAALIVPALAIAALALVVQAVLLRSVLDIGHWLGIGEHRLGAAAGLLVLLAAVLLLDVPINLAIARVGRKLETALRLAFLQKVPRIADQYFHSRLLSDMAERLHAITTLRSLPALATGWLRSLFSMIFTAGGIVWLAPSLLPLVVASIVVSLVATWASVALLQDREMRLRSHGGTLIRFYLDALMGIASIRAHGAGKSLLREQEGLLVHWSDANRRLQIGATWVEALQAISVGAIAVWMVLRQVAAGGATGSILLITYWALELPVLAQGLAVAARQVPPIRNVLIRLLEPLDAPEETPEQAPASVAAVGAAAEPAFIQRPTMTSAITAPLRREGVHVSLSNVTVRAGGHHVLENVSLDIQPGRQIAIVGKSGAGKSTLFGLLLGWFRAASGSVRLDGEPLVGTSLAKWRRRIAWVDPSVQLFNRRFVDNLLYGSESGVGEIAGAVEETELREVLERLPEGLQTILGEGGALVSGGEGQRLRLGRAWLRQDVRLVLL